MSGRVRINNPITHNRKVEENMITRHDIAFMVQEIISECHSRPKGAEMIDLIDKYADKFGKDNNALVPLDEEEVANALVDAHGILNKHLLKKEYYLPYAKTICAKFGKDNSEFGHSGDKTVSSYPEDNQQPPKERKVSLEEIDLRVLLSNYDGSYHRDSDYIRGLSKAILSLINATEERKGSDELDKAKDHIMFLLPMAKGYAYPKNIKANLEMIKNAEEFIKPNIN